jgi:hypothetical protein
MPRYRAYCLTIQSDVELPELPGAKDEPDLVLRVGEVHVPAPREHSGYMPFVADGEQTVLFLDGVGKAAIRGGREIVVEPAAGSDGAALRAFVVGPMMAQLLSQRGLEVLHASAVEIDGAAHVLIGASGAGKSSIALNLALLGARLLADDVVAVERAHDGTVLVHPGAGLANVRHAEAERLGAELLARIGPEVGADEKGVRLRVPLPAEPAPMRGLYFLRRGAPTRDVEH